MMRAVLTTAHGDRTALRVQHHFPEPQPSADEVVIRVAATAVNFHDIFTRRGMPGIRIALPIIVGSDIAGVIAALGAQVQDWRVGERVLVDPVHRDGQRFGMIGETRHGGRAEFVAVPAAQLIRVPEDVSLDTAATLPLAYGTAHRMMVSRARIPKGARVLILGASGGVGVACVQLAILLGARVIACASSRQKTQRLAALGADHCIDYSQERLPEAVWSICGKPRIGGGGGVDFAVNFTGGDTWTDTQKCVARGGSILTCGATAGFSLSTDARYLWSFEHQIVGSNGWSPTDLQVLLDLVRNRTLCPVIDRTLPLEESAEAERLLEDREIFGKVLLKP